jgi:hypothetical protein
MFFSVTCLLRASFTNLSIFVVCVQLPVEPPVSPRIHTNIPGVAKVSKLVLVSLRVCYYFLWLHATTTITPPSVISVDHNQFYF